MKKYFLSLVAIAAAMLFATSCQESLVEPQMEGPTTFTVQLPDGMGTKAYGDEASTKATINRLYVEVYSQDGGTLVYEPSSAISMDNATATVELNLVSTQKYDIIFWAQNESCTYDVSDLRSVKMNANHHNSETGAAFYAVLNDYTPVNGQQGVTLTRPFAQLNLATNTEVSYANGTNNKVTIESAKITVKGVAPSFDRIIDKTYGEGYAPSNEVTYTYKNTDATTNSHKADGTITVANKEYQYVSMDYFAVPGGDQSTVQVTAEITVTDPNGVESTITRIIENVPVQLNYKTNIVGNLITSATDFTVTIDESWNTPNNDKEVEFREVSTATELQEAINQSVDNIILTGDITLGDQPLVFRAQSSQSQIARASVNENSFVLDLNGKNLKGSISVDKGVDLIVNNGNIVSENRNYSGIVSNGDLTLNNVNITSARHALRIESGKAVIDGGVYKVEPATGTSMTLHALNVGDDNTSAEVLIKNGEFIGPRGKNADSGSAVKVRDGSKVTIENGVFSGGKNETLKANQGDLVVKGGEFDQNPASWVAEGYKAVKAADEDNADNRETYVVIPATENYDIVITDPKQLKDKVLGDNTNILLQLAAREYTIDLYTSVSASDSRNLTIIGTEGTKVKFDKDQVRLVLFKSFTIKNCEILHMATKSWGMLVFSTGNNAKGVYTIENCTFNGVETQGIYINEEKTGATYNIINCTFNGDFDNIDGKDGAITIQTNKDVYHTVNVKGCKFNDIPETCHRIFLAPYDGDKGLFYGFTLDTDLKATTAYELEMFLNMSNQVNVAKGNYTFPATSIKEGQTIICEEGTVFTETSSLNINGAKVINATFSNPNGSAVSGTINGVFENCTFTGSNALRWCYAGETVEFINCVFDGSVYGVHFDGGANDVIFDNCVLSGFNAFAGEITSLTFNDCIFKSNGRSGYNGANLWCGATMTNCEFSFDGSARTEWIDCINADGRYNFNNCTINTIEYTSTNYTECNKIFSSNDATVTINGVECSL